MKYCVDQLIQLCLEKEVIQENQVAWFRYCIEKRLFTVVGFLTMLVFAAKLSDAWSSLWFFTGIYTLRRWTNGYHAKTMYGCLVVSLSCEILFLKVVLPNLSVSSAILLCLICFGIILSVAPFNHPNMNYTKKEIQALKRVTQQSVFVLLWIILILGMLSFHKAIRGLTTGIALATFLLCLAYIIEWGKPIWKKRKKNLKEFQDSLPMQ